MHCIVIQSLGFNSASRVSIVFTSMAQTHTSVCRTLDVKYSKIKGNFLLQILSKSYQFTTDLFRHKSPGDSRVH